MQFILKRKILFILLFSGIASLASGQTPEDALNFANEQYHLKNYSVALKEYQRYFFFRPEPVAAVFYNIGNCFQNTGQFNSAVEFYDKAFNNFIVDSLRINALFKKIECYILQHEYGLALTELFGISDTVSKADIYKREFYTGVCYFGMADYENAGQSFVNSIDTTFGDQRSQIRQLFADKKNFERPNPKTALLLSMLFPGLGQFYTGDIRNGMNSLLLTSALAYLGFSVAFEQSPLDAIITVLPWFQRYYQGGYLKAEQIAITKRAEKKARIYKRTLAIIASTRN